MNLFIHSFTALDRLTRLAEPSKGPSHSFGINT